MNTFDLGRSFAQEQDRKLTQILYEALQDGLAPWEPGRVRLYVSEDASGRVLAIESERFPELVFRSKPDHFLQDPSLMVLSMAEKVFKFYRYRRALPVDDHIILGEE